jgi:predicted esterase
MTAARLASLLAAASLFMATAAPAQDAAPFPAGMSSQTLEGLKVSIVMPDAFDPARERSMMVILHGAGGTETGMAGSLMHLAKEDFVVVAPKSKGQVWEAGDLEAVKRIVADLKKRLRVGERRLHAAGFSNGGWNLAPVAFDEALRFQSATWLAAGFKGGKPPRHAKKEMGVLALAGAEDGNRDAAEATPRLLGDKVRSAEARIQPRLGHAWPGELVPYWTWWLGVQEGRYTPGDCAAFAWRESAEAALAAGAEAKTGSFVYWYSAADAQDEKARAFQNDVTRSALVQRFGSQLPCAKCDRDADPEGFAKSGLAATPGVVVYDAAGKAKASFARAIEAAPLAAALRRVAPDKSLPKD